ncbi:baeyer-Villiger monooxygenase-like [Bradysia coprophila]|uniref:baeyer-Villiger monooxygenase-like n=1 Tax=Bradysia coprophila TaxID=38358 RepID=UPI00187DD441|nr:baeyer-Villiger monooxygenase-like [Bradysia coprophila]XP_037025069.1 baeyer-Villiger monooxygenase-like [Bradysia coprophila]
MAASNSIDTLIVGAGFSGLHLLQKLRKLGFAAKVYERGSDIGGTWYWNRYPGVRVDSDHTFYQYSQDDIWKGFDWSERFPGQAELERYFKHVDCKLNLSKDIYFNTTVTSAEFCGKRNQWLVKTNIDGRVTWASTLLLCTGAADFRYTPSFPGLDQFKGVTCHTSLWPKDLNLEGKRVAVIGTGASGIQVIQEIAPKVNHLTVYQRTPNIALPMQQSIIEDQTNWTFPSDKQRQEILTYSRTTYSGLDMESIQLDGANATPEERRIVFEDLFRRGGFHFICANYRDLLLNREVNSAAYEFWCEVTRARINDPIKKDILAPLIAPHPFGAKRNSLEQNYYEVFNQNNVDIIDVRKSPIIGMTADGIETVSEGEVKVDVIIFATGFDALTGAILNIDIKNDERKSLKDKWRKGVCTNVGMTTADFPNMFFLYGPQAPTSFANGPSLAEIQGDWIIRLLVYMRTNKMSKVVATQEAERNWKKMVTEVWNMSLLPEAESWYQGANIPGKTKETLIFLGGIPRYVSILEDSAKDGYSGFVLS